MRGLPTLLLVPLLAAGVVAALVPIPRAEPAPRPAPLTTAQKLALWEASLDPVWESVSAAWPGTARPTIQLPFEVTSEQYGSAVTTCLREAGWRVVELGGGGYQPIAPKNADRRALAVGEYECNSRYAYAGTFDALLGTDERAALWVDYTTRLAPCLLMIGERPARAPTREQFLDPRQPFSDWNPYRSIDGGDDPSELERVDRLCPLEPGRPE